MECAKNIEKGGIKIKNFQQFTLILPTLSAPTEIQGSVFHSESWKGKTHRFGYIWID